MNNDKVNEVAAVLSLFLMVVIAVSSSVYVAYSQQQQDIFEFDEQFTKLGMQYKFNNGWADELSGKIYPINQSAFIIEWYRYDETTPLKNETFHNKDARAYTVELDTRTFNNNTKFLGRFYIAWFNGKELVGVDVSEGYLVIRDINRVPRLYYEIEKVRIYEYKVGEMN